VSSQGSAYEFRPLNTTILLWRQVIGSGAQFGWAIPRRALTTYIHSSCGQDLSTPVLHSTTVHGSEWLYRRDPPFAHWSIHVIVDHIFRLWKRRLSRFSLGCNNHLLFTAFEGRIRSVSFPSDCVGIVWSDILNLSTNSRIAKLVFWTLSTGIVTRYGDLGCI
jgi:hypothetical protein